MRHGIKIIPMETSTTFDFWFSFAEVVMASIMLIKKAVWPKHYTRIWKKKGKREENKMTTKEEERELKKKILDFAEEHKWQIHPRKSLNEHVTRVLELGGACPCRATRTCPCPEASEDIMGRGACVCT